MSMQVVTGALCMCTMGTAPTPLNVLPTNRTMAGSMPAANIMDNVPFLNIIPFAMCNSQANPATQAATAAAFGVPTPGPCTPVTPAPWAPGAPTVMIGNMPALDSTSTLMCAYGGTISITFPGQVTVMIP